MSEAPLPSALAALVAAGETPVDCPVETWNPAHCGHSHMRILADGTWLHEGNPIHRAPLVRLFATLLRREPDGTHALVTPAERLVIEVDDAPFVAVEVASEGSGHGRRLAFRLNTADVVLAGPDHAITLNDGRPYLHVRRGLQALIARPVFYELAELALAEDADAGADAAALWSDGARFALA